jgi:hypothetical protein
MKSCAPLFLLLLVSPFVAAQNTALLETAPRHFRWSQRQAHELDYDRTIRKSTNLTSAEKKSLIDAIVQTLKREDDDVDMTARELIDLASETRVEFVDLRSDGQREVIAQANGLGPCGGTGNCVFWIFQLTPGGAKVLLDTTLAGGVRFELLTVRPWMTNGFKDIVLASHSSATARNIWWFRSTNGKYRPSTCYYPSWIGDHGEFLKNPDISSEPCD